MQEHTIRKSKTKSTDKNEPPLSEPSGARGRAGKGGGGKAAAPPPSGTRPDLQHLLAASPAIIYTTHASGDFSCTFVSENIKAIMGYEPSEMTTDPKCWPDRLHPDDAPTVFAELALLVEKGRGTVEYRFRHRDGSYIWIQDTFKVVYDEKGNAFELVGAWADITKRKQSEQKALETNLELQATKRSLSHLIESAPDAIVATDRDANITLFNEGAETLLGYRSEEVIGRPVAMLYGGEAGVNEVLREMRKRGGTIASFDSVLWAKDASSIPVLISASLLFDDDGEQIGTVGFATDQRGHKQAQDELQKAYDVLEKCVDERTAELKEARGRLQYLLTVTPGIMYTNNSTGSYACTFVSRNIEPIMGFSEWEMLEDPEFWPKRLHPDDTKRVFDEMGPLVQKGGGTVEYRFRHRNGHYVWIQDTFKVVHDDDGRPLEIVGSWADITHRKQVEKALGERMALMNDLQNLVAASPAVIYTTKASGDYACTFVSENLMSTMGYAPWEMREDPEFWSKRIHPDDAQQVFAKIASLVETGGGTIEYRFRHRRGDYIWLQDTFRFIEGANGKELVGSWADITDRKRVESEVERLAKEVELRNKFIRDTFGRYLTDEVVTALLDSPMGLNMGGEKRKVTMVMADLRGFTSLSETLSPKWVVTILNRFFDTMVKIIKRYDGTVDEFIGDSIFILFGAPVWRDDDAQRAAACAIEMQLAMNAVNELNRQDDLPDVAMGIGIHTGQVVVGNIGSPERMKYGVVGSNVNLTSRIQACTTGGQILVSEATRREVGGSLKIGKQIEVRTKGFTHPVTLAEVRGIGAPYKLSLYKSNETLVSLAEEIPIGYSIAEEDRLDRALYHGGLTRLSLKHAEARLEEGVAILSNLEMHLTDADGRQIPGILHGKVTGTVDEETATYSLSIMSMSPEIETFLRGRLEAPAGMPESTPMHAAKHSALSEPHH